MRSLLSKELLVNSSLTLFSAILIVLSFPLWRLSAYLGRADSLVFCAQPDKNVQTGI